MLCVSLYRFLRIIKNFSVKLTFAALPYSMHRPAPRGAGRRWALLGGAERSWALLCMAERFLNLPKRFLQKTKSEIRKQNPKSGSRTAYFCSFFHKTCCRRLYYGQSSGLGPALLYDLSTRRRFCFPNSLKRFLQKTKLPKKKTDHLRNKL